MIRSLHPVDVNDRVEVELPEEPQAGRYRARVHGLTPQRLILALPSEKGEPVRLRPGTELVLHAFRSDPLDGARYRARARVVSQQAEPHVTLLLVEPQQWERIQLRDYTRTPAGVPVRLRVLPAAGRAGWQTVDSRDVGGGGLSFVCPRPLAEGARLELWVELPDGPVTAIGEVVRCVPAPQKSGRLYTVAVRFAAIEEAHRDRLLAFVLRRQAELLRLSHKLRSGHEPGVQP